MGPEPTFGDWVEVGCYTEATNSRALTLGTKVNYSTMELGICADYCLALDALYFGVEYGGEVRTLILTILSNANLCSVTVVMSSRLVVFLLRMEAA